MSSLFEWLSVGTMLNMSMIPNKAGKILVFGASSGIGNAVLFELDHNRYDVVAISRSKDYPSPPHINKLSLDLASSESSISRTLDKATSPSVLAGLVYCPANPFPLQDITTYTQQDILDSILLSTASLHSVLKWFCKYASLHKSSEMPSILVLSSKSASSISKYSGFLYSHSKASQLSLSRHYAKYLAEKKLANLNIVTPDLVETPLSKKVLGDKTLSSQITIEPSRVAKVIAMLLQSKDLELHSSTITINNHGNISF